MDAAPRDSNKGRETIDMCIVICFGAVDVLALLIRVLVAGKRCVGMGRLEDRGGNCLAFYMPRVLCWSIMR